VRPGDFHGQWKTSGWCLTRDCEGDDGSRSLIEDVVANHEHWADAGLFMAAHWIEIGPPNLAS
jgi:hypothetical protein